MLARICASYEADPGRRQDLMQEVALAIWQALPAFRGEGNIKAFLARITHNRCVTHVAREVKVPRGPEIGVDFPHDGSTPEDHTANDQMRKGLMQAVRALPLSQRQVVVLVLEGFSYREVGHALGISEGNVAVRFNRAKSALRLVLEHQKNSHKPELKQLREPI